MDFAVTSTRDIATWVTPIWEIGAEINRAACNNDSGIDVDN
jgi:hypothetical protein